MTNNELDKKITKQKEYYDWRYSDHIHPFPRIHYEIRYQLVKKMITKIYKSLNKNKTKRIRVLDVGCGVGEYGIFFEDELGCDYIGVDISEAGVNYATYIYVKHKNS